MKTTTIYEYEPNIGIEAPVWQRDVSGRFGAQR